MVSMIHHAKITFFTVRRIDSNVDEMDHNVSGAQNELFKYLNSISSNRCVSCRVFGMCGAEACFIAHAGCWSQKCSQL
jgi:hypothetical protein